MSDTDNTTEPDWSKVPLSEEYTWVDATSSKGTPYKIGTPKEAIQTQASEGAEALNLNAVPLSLNAVREGGKSPFDIKVNWIAKPPPMGFGQQHKPSPEETRITSITSYLNNKSPFRYNEFSFCCTEAYHFYFYDMTGDYYGLNVVWPRPLTLHTFFFFSSNPTIVRVTGK